MNFQARVSYQMIASEYKAFQALEKITETYVAIKCFNIHVAVGETTF